MECASSFTALLTVRSKKGSTAPLRRLLLLPRVTWRSFGLQLLGSGYQGVRGNWACLLQEAWGVLAKADLNQRSWP